VDQLDKDYERHAGYKGRDVEVVVLDDGKCMVMACDSSGAIGEKELDLVKASPYLVGRLTARVALLEVISVGARPQMLSATISNEPFPTGEQVLKGVRDELHFMQLDHVLKHITISTEKNFETKQTAIGITVIGVCKPIDLKISSSENQDSVYLLGLPKVGNEIQGFDDQEIVNGQQVMQLLENSSVHDILPIGSKGISKELELMCANSALEFVLDPRIAIDIEKSAGPSTCLIVTIAKDAELGEFDALPIAKIGILNSIRKNLLR
jgi:hypothetical protein